MDHDTIRDLLPFYVNGTLTQEERSQVADALASSAELRKELRFWELAAGALSAHASAHGQGHLSAHQIVDRASGTAPAQDLPGLDDHLRSCTECAGLVERARSSIIAAGADIPAMTSMHTPRRFPRWVYAVAFVALVITAIVSLVPDPDVPHNTATSPALRVPVPAGVPTRIPTVDITYHPRLRSGPTTVPQPMLLLGDADSLARLTIAIPHNAIRGIRYAVFAGATAGTRTLMMEQMARSREGTLFDTLVVIVDAALLRRSAPATSITVREQLPRELVDVTPEEYVMEIVIRRLP